MATQLHKVEAQYYATSEWDQANCHLCPHVCVIAPSRTGLCGVRSNRNGVLYADSYGKLARVTEVSSEEIPLVHYHPGAKWLLVGMKGCNLRCPFCSTYQFSQTGAVRAENSSPQDVINRAIARGATGIAFGVNEPLVAFEFVMDVFRLARQNKLETCLETNGSWMEEPLYDVLELTSVITFGFKEFDSKFLNNECGGELSYVKRALEIARSQRVRVETSLVLLDHHPKWIERTREFAQWLGAIDAEIPCVLHPLASSFMWEGLEANKAAAQQARTVMQEHLRYVYAPGSLNVSCPCGYVLVTRNGSAPSVRLEKNHTCPQCGAGTPVRLPASRA